MVLHEEQHSKCSNSNSGGGGSRSSKKNKPKKIPQRGLGVAQLEMIRLQEQQQNNAAAASSSNSSPALILPPTSQPSSLSFLTPHDPNPLFRSAINSSSPAIEFFNPTPLHVPDAGSTMGKAVAIEGTSKKFLPMLWNVNEQSSPNDAAESTVAGKFSFRAARVALPPSDLSNANHNWRCTGLFQRSHHQQQSPVQLVNKTTSHLSSGVNLQMEPPSNQNSSINLKTPWQEEERMVGTNRPWAFHPDTMSGLTSSCKIPPFTTPFLKPDESMLMYGNDPWKFEFKSTGSREGASSSSTYQGDWRGSDLHINKRIKENGSSMDGDFLTLGSSLTQTMSRPKQPMANSPSRHHEHPEFTSLVSQGGMNNTISLSGDLSQHLFYSFLPMGQTTQETALKEGSGEALDGVDTNLKL